MSCRSLKRSPSSHSLSSYTTLQESQLLLPSRLDHQCPSHFGMLLCRRLHLVTSPRRCPRRRLINRTRLSCDVAVQTSFHGAHTFSLDAAVADDLTLQYLVSACLSRRWVLAQLPRFLLICLGRLLYAVRCYMMLPHNYRSRSSNSLAVFTRTDPPGPPNPLCSSVPATMMQGSHALLQPFRQDSNSQPRLLSLPLTLTCLLHMVRLLTVLPVMPWQSPVSTSSRCGNTPCMLQLPAPKGVLVPPLREPTMTSSALILVHRHHRPLPEPRALVRPMVKFGQPKSDRLGHIDTVDSDLMHHQFRLSLLQWRRFPGLARRNPTLTLSPLPVVSFMRLFFRSQRSCQPHISDQFRAYTKTIHRSSRYPAQQGHL